ncbi:hypothetical protein BGU52_19425, partial [Clostridioides difficile]
CRRELLSVIHQMVWRPRRIKQRGALAAADVDNRKVLLILMYYLKDLKTYELLAVYVFQL